MDTDVLINLLKKTEEKYLYAVITQLSLDYDAILIPKKVKKEFISLKPKRESDKHQRLLDNLYESFVSERFMDCPINNSRMEIQQLIDTSEQIGCLIQIGEADAILQGKKCAELETLSEVYVLTGDKCAIEFINRHGENLKVKPLPYEEWKKQFMEAGITLP